MAKWIVGIELTVRGIGTFAGRKDAPIVLEVEAPTLAEAIEKAKVGLVQIRFVSVILDDVRVKDQVPVEEAEIEVGQVIG